RRAIEHRRAAMKQGSGSAVATNTTARIRSRTTEEEPLRHAEVRRPLEALRFGKAEIGMERLAHRLDEAVLAPRIEALLPPEAVYAENAGVAIDARLDSTDEAVAEEDRQHVPAEAPFGRRMKELQREVEVEQGPQETTVPDKRIERREKRHGRRWLRRRDERLDRLRHAEALAAHAVAGAR